ncbi:YdgA family protein [Bordetella pseudohinzii]|uniref:Bacterial protein of uncharacterized function (DUF945) n=1 Tax=Bordetella pseudohinzii TaxID=1331258 RepID=A0A0J6C1T3_9BORD|nr:YdgA family protein [Bordetella pseudohinzii]ANY17656.1 hypothetical protein BBN53_18265 [Bordetella pseudohinzii]KMM24731.1 hypothetical protein L540_04210 [Bordetella pseudohinzii]KXA76905.1 hypothetical protein AW877_15630 [Bordetella pseudohinzii]KXA77217.1 hypothetical protein AW878_15950 [Bordetella pseudohinzii]CUJ01004.1 Bacterial protein of uncharacterised function (DUF945) [Bordetella pseudohinzii]
MKKGVAIGAGVVVVVAAAWLGGTWYTGQRIADDSQARLEQVNAYLAATYPGTGLHVEQLSFVRGFFSTQARYGLAATALPGSPLKPGERLEFDARVDHGPLPAGALARGHFLPAMAYVHTEMADTEAARPFFAAAQGKNPLLTNLVLQYGGGASVQAEAAPLQWAEPKVDFGGARFEGDIGKHLGSLKGQLQAKPITLLLPKDETLPATQVRLGDSVADFDSKLGKAGYQVGTSSLRIDRVEIQPQGDGGSWLSEDITYKGLVTEDDRFLNGQVDISAGKLALNGAALGSQQISMKFTRLDGQKLKAVNEVYVRLAQQAAEQGRKPGDFSGEQTRQLAEAALPLLADNPTLTLDPFAWKNDKGESRLSLALTLAQPADRQARGADLTRQLIKSLEARLVLNKPMMTAMGTAILKLQGASEEEAARQAARQVNNIAGMAMMLNLGKAQGDDLIGTLQYGDGKLNLNGRDMPTDALMGALPR